MGIAGNVVAFFADLPAAWLGARGADRTGMGRAGEATLLPGAPPVRPGSGFTLGY